MNLEVKIVPELMSRYIKNGGELLFEIAWENQGLYYPMISWSDFGVVILGWWVSGVSSVIKNKENTFELSFMDGPYSLKMEIDWLTQQVVMSSEDGRFHAKSSIIEVKQQLFNAIKLIDLELSTHNILTNDREYLANLSKLLTT
jgi:hypothetical protein